MSTRWYCCSCFQGFISRSVQPSLCPCVYGNMMEFEWASLIGQARPPSWQKLSNLLYVRRYDLKWDLKILLGKTVISNTHISVGLAHNELWLDLYHERDWEADSIKSFSTNTAFNQLLSFWYNTKISLYSQPSSKMFYIKPISINISKQHLPERILSSGEQKVWGGLYVPMRQCCWDWGSGIEKHLLVMKRSQMSSDSELITKQLSTHSRPWLENPNPWARCFSTLL